MSPKLSRLTPKEVVKVLQEYGLEVAAVDPAILDEKLEIRIKEGVAIEAAKELHHVYGHYVGISAGADFAAAMEISKSESGNAVIIFPDSGDRYASVLGVE